MASNFIEKITRTSLLKMEIVLMLAGMVDVVKVFQKMETPTKPSSTELFSGGGITSCNKALLRLSPVERTAVLKGTTGKLIRWHKRAARAYLFLYPKIYGLGSMKEQAASVARALGVGRHATKTWFSLSNNKSRFYMEKWVPLVREIFWKGAAGDFPPDWTSQWGIGEDKLIPDNHILLYKKKWAADRFSFRSSMQIRPHLVGSQLQRLLRALLSLIQTVLNCKEMTSKKGENINSRRDSFRTW